LECSVQLGTQPDLALFTLDMLTIPMMSVECEKVFSSAKHLITDSRNRLNLEIIEANECLKHWFGKPEEQESDSEVAEEVVEKTSKNASDTGDVF
jgi:hAT family C-terminal dimerisation region